METPPTEGLDSPGPLHTSKSHRLNHPSTGDTADRRLDESAVAGVDTLGVAPTHGNADIQTAGRSMYDSTAAGQGLFDTLGVVSNHQNPSPATVERVPKQGGSIPRRGVSSPPSRPPPPPPSRPSQPPPRPALPPEAPSATPPPLPPSPSLVHLEAVSPSHMRVAGTTQFAGMVFNVPPPPSPPPPRQVAVTNLKKKLFGRGRNEPDAGVPAASSVRSEDRQNLLDEISSASHAALRHTDQPRSPGGTPIGGKVSSPDKLQRALLTKFHSLHSTPLNQPSRFARQDFSGSLDFSNAWSDVNTSQVFDDPDISASSLSGLASSKNDTSHVHNGSRLCSEADLVVVKLSSLW